MLQVLICDDEQAYRSMIEKIITQHISSFNLDIKVALATGNPDDILAFLEDHSGGGALYFLDVDLQREIDGITLGTRIRQADPLAKIVFITTHGELAFLTFKKKVEAMDYIVKQFANDMKPRIIECLDEAKRLYLEENTGDLKLFTVKTDSLVTNVPYNDILFFESHPRVDERILLHTKTGKFDFRGTLKNVENLAPEFFRCHKSYIVNPENIVNLNKAERVAAFANGQEVLVAKDKVSALLKLSS